MSYNQEDINALFPANTTVQGEVLNIKVQGKIIPIKVTVKLYKDRDSKNYSLVNNNNIQTCTLQNGCHQQYFIVRQGRHIHVLLKNLHIEPIKLKAIWFIDQEKGVVDDVMIQPQSEYTLPLTLCLQQFDKMGSWKFHFNGQTSEDLVLMFEKDDGEKTIEELLDAIKKLVKAYERY